MNWQSGDPTGSHASLATIAEVRAATGVSARTLRYYEELGLLPGVRRRAGGRRVYGPDEVERLRFIQRLKRLGLSLAEVKELNAVYAIAGSTRDMLARLDEQLGAQAASVEARIRELEGLHAELGQYRDHVNARIRDLSGNAGAEAVAERSPPDPDGRTADGKNGSAASRHAPMQGGSK